MGRESMNQIIKAAQLVAAVFGREIGEDEVKGLITISTDFYKSVPTVKVHVTSTYFDKHFEATEEENMPMQNKVELICKPQPNITIFCLKNAKFERVA
jgi:hypothetical protein